MTRVANPFSLNEMRRLREAVRVFPDPEARARVCRNLYGRSSPEDTRAFVNRELAAQTERASERWGFDFLREVPRASDRFLWCPVKPGGVPAAYALRRMACLGSTLTVKISSTPVAPSDSTMETASTTVTTTSRRGTSAVSPLMRGSPAPKQVDRTPSPVSSAPAPLTSVNKRQAQITDFMKCRKRPSVSAAAKEGNPAKRARISSETSMSC